VDFGPAKISDAIFLGQSLQLSTTVLNDSLSLYWTISRQMSHSIAIIAPLYITVIIVGSSVSLKTDLLPWDCTVTSLESVLPCPKFSFFKFS